MATPRPTANIDKTLDDILGFLNFSSGNEDPHFFKKLDILFAWLEQRSVLYPWSVAGELLEKRLRSVRTTNPAFAEASQATRLVRLLFEQLLPEYMHFHGDLLSHISHAHVFNAFFVGRAAQAALRTAHQLSDDAAATRAAIRELNDYVGHRPVPMLQNQRHEPYPHEWIRPVPLYLKDVGVVSGPYQEVVQRALEILEGTNEDLLRAAYFDPDRVVELAFDPRAYDFEHPVNKRPNYHFGQWDPHHIAQDGYYDRFVIQKVTLDALMARVPKKTKRSGERREHLLEEAAAVLAGVILMASAVSGDRPDSHNSDVTLGNLLPRIARFRDEFYERLLDRTSEPHRSQLLAEARKRQQPFGGARQDLNAELSRRRADQLTRVHLAKLFARMGYDEAAEGQIRAVRTPSARLQCRVDCLLTKTNLAIRRGQLEESASMIADVIDALHRGIDCGALADPWCILGFDAHFSLFPSIENSIYDHRLEELLELVHRIFACMAKLWSEAAAADNDALCATLDLQFGDLATWWRQFAAHEVEALDCDDAQDIYRSAKLVADAMRLWHKGGAEAGDIAFWRQHVDSFDAPKAFNLVVRALLERRDLVASMALLVTWLDQAEHVPLESQEGSFSQLAEDWLVALHEQVLADRTADASWPQVAKFLDFLEANAAHRWQPPRHWEQELPGMAVHNGLADDTFPGGSPQFNDEDDDEDEDEDADEYSPQDRNLYAEAYKDVVYQDSTDDGIEGGIFDPSAKDQPDDAEGSLQEAAVGLAGRLDFLNCVARLWRLAALWPNGVNETPHQRRAARRGALQRWLQQSLANRRGLLQLLDSVAAEQLRASRGDQRSLMEYDRQRLTKEGLLEHVINSYCEAADASLVLTAAQLPLGAEAAGEPGTLGENSIGDPHRPASDRPQKVVPLQEGDLDSPDQHLAACVLAAVLDHDPATARQRYRQWRDALRQEPLLYVPLARGGQPRLIAEARLRQGTMQELLQWLPRAGLLRETCELIETARLMERDNPVGAGAVTEFDELFTAGYSALVEAIIDSSHHWKITVEPQKKLRRQDEAAPAAEKLVSCLELLMESVLTSWLTHSRTLRLSVLERVYDEDSWQRLRAFIERYGGEIFSQSFLNLSNVRAILHQGVGHWLAQLTETPEEGVATKLLLELETRAARDAACDQLSMILEAIIENYGEYRDYNSTTTQSDRGELLFSLIDFLRLRTRYDRLCWNLRPVNLAHEVLVRRDQKTAARLWRRTLTERIEPEADRFLKKLKSLQRKYAMQLTTVADRLSERFTRTLTIDRIRALVKPAIQERLSEGPTPSFEMLERESIELTKEPSGAGLEVPPWLAALEEEAERVLEPNAQDARLAPLPASAPSLTYDEVQEQLNSWAEVMGRFRPLLMEPEDD